MNTLNNILDLKERFDVFIFDAYGVFWNGKDFYKGSIEAMEELVKNCKVVYILSNTATLVEDFQKKYEKRGLIKCVHYNEMITSGEALRDALLNDEIYFTKNLKARKVYQFGKPHKKLFKETDYVEVDKLSDAQLVYISTPQLNEEEYNSLKDKYGKYLFEAKIKEGEPRRWNSTIIEPFIPLVEKIFKSGLPILNANPDYVALEEVKNENKTVYAIRQGAITEALKKCGAEVIEYGKPNEEIYKFTLKDLIKHDINTEDKSRICMVGDTLRTDIKGANNVGISTVLCIGNGVTADEIAKGKKLEDLINEEDVFVDYTIKTVGKN